MSNPASQHVDAANRSPVRCAAIVIGQWRHNVTGETTFDAYYNGVVIAGATSLADCIETVNRAINADLGAPAGKTDVHV